MHRWSVLVYFNSKYFQMPEFHVKEGIILSNGICSWRNTTKVFYYKYCITFFFFFKGEHLSKLLDRVRISWSPLQVAQTTRGVQLFDPKTWLAICIFIIHLRCHTACGSLQAGFDTEIFKTWSSVSSVNLPNIPRNLSFSPVLSLPFCQPLNK